MRAAIAAFLREEAVTEGQAVSKPHGHKDANFQKIVFAELNRHKVRRRAGNRLFLWLLHGTSRSPSAFFACIGCAKYNSYSFFLNR